MDIRMWRVENTRGLGGLSPTQWKGAWKSEAPYAPMIRFSPWKRAG